MSKRTHEIMEMDVPDAGNDAAQISLLFVAENITQTIDLFMFVSLEVCGEEETFAAYALESDDHQPVISQTPHWDYGEPNCRFRTGWILRNIDRCSSVETRCGVDVLVPSLKVQLNDQSYVGYLCLAIENCSSANCW
jgi:hypothetical protein